MNKPLNITEITLGEFKTELKVYNKTINNYNYTYNLHWGSKYNIKDYTYDGYGDIRDYHVITEKFIETLRQHATRLKIYQWDYYQKKTIEEVATKINIPTRKVVKHINNYIDSLRPIGKCEIGSVSNLLEGHIAGPKTVLDQISSYQIHEEICYNERLELIELEVNNYKKTLIK